MGIFWVSADTAQCQAWLKKEKKEPQVLQPKPREEKGK